MRDVTQTTFKLHIVIIRLHWDNSQIYNAENSAALILICTEMNSNVVAA
jgi:hypothetical protein